MTKEEQAQEAIDSLETKASLLRIDIIKIKRAVEGLNVSLAEVKNINNIIDKDMGNFSDEMNNAGLRYYETNSHNSLISGIKKYISSLENTIAKLEDKKKKIEIELDEVNDEIKRKQK